MLGLNLVTEAIVTRPLQGVDQRLNVVAPVWTDQLVALGWQVNLFVSHVVLNTASSAFGGMVKRAPFAETGCGG